MNRRAFLIRFSTAVVGAAVATKIPTQWLPVPIQRYAACEYLRKTYNDYTKGRNLREHPRVLHVGHDLYEAFENELIGNMRFGGFDDTSEQMYLMFKGARVFPAGGGWWAKVVA